MFLFAHIESVKSAFSIFLVDGVPFARVIWKTQSHASFIATGRKKKSSAGWIEPGWLELIGRCSPSELAGHGAKKNVVPNLNSAYVRYMNTFTSFCLYLIRALNKHKVKRRLNFPSIKALKYIRVCVWVSCKLSLLIL